MDQVRILARSRATLSRRKTGSFSARDKEFQRCMAFSSSVFWRS
jgi:hypothetical protein